MLSKGQFKHININYSLHLSAWVYLKTLGIRNPIVSSYGSFFGPTTYCVGDDLPQI